MQARERDVGSLARPAWRSLAWLPAKRREEHMRGRGRACGPRHVPPHRRPVHAGASEQDHAHGSLSKPSGRVPASILFEKRQLEGASRREGRKHRAGATRAWGIRRAPLIGWALALDSLYWGPESSSVAALSTFPVPPQRLATGFAHTPLGPPPIQTCRRRKARHRFAPQLSPPLTSAPAILIHRPLPALLGPPPELKRRNPHLIRAPEKQSEGEDSSPARNQHSLGGSAV